MPDLKSTLKSFRREIEYCSYCPKLCRFACPVAQVEKSETVTPTGKMTLVRLLRDGVLPFDAETADVFYRCTGCLISRTYCEHRIEVMPPFEAARAEAVAAGVAPPRAMQALAVWQKQGNPFGEDLAAKVKQHLPERYLEGSAEVLLFPGCTTLHYHPQNLGAIARVLAALKVDFRVLYQGRICCGNPLLTLGHRQAFQAQRKELAARLDKAKVIISPCPTCVYYLKHLDSFGARVTPPAKPRIMHLTEFVAARLADLSVREPVPEKIMYHDPCHLGRYLGVYDQPRAILEKASGRKPLEFDEHREAGTCCGGGGGVPLIHPQTARAISLNKMQAFAQSGAERLATACPMCQRMLGRSGRESGAKVEDVIGVLARSLGTQE